MLFAIYQSLLDIVTAIKKIIVGDMDLSDMKYLFHRETPLSVIKILYGSTKVKTDTPEFLIKSFGLAGRFIPQINVAQITPQTGSSALIKDLLKQIDNQPGSRAPYDAFKLAGVDTLINLTGTEGTLAHKRFVRLLPKPVDVLKRAIEICQQDPKSDTLGYAILLDLFFGVKLTDERVAFISGMNKLIVEGFAFLNNETKEKYTQFITTMIEQWSVDKKDDTSFGKLCQEHLVDDSVDRETLMKDPMLHSLVTALITGANVDRL
jgi:hypothetical protein